MNGHDPDAADELIREFSSSLQNQTLFENGLGRKEKVFIQYIRNAFTRYTDGKPLDAAFGFALGRGEKDRNPSIDMRNLVISARVEQIVREDLHTRGETKPRCVMKKFRSGKGKMESKVKMEPIYAEVGRASNLSAKAIEGIFRTHESSVGSLSNDALALLAGHLTKCSR